MVRIKNLTIGSESEHAPIRYQTFFIKIISSHIHTRIKYLQIMNSKEKELVSMCDSFKRIITIRTTITILLSYCFIINFNNSTSNNGNVFDSSSAIFTFRFSHIITLTFNIFLCCNLLKVGFHFLFFRCFFNEFVYSFY